MLGDIVSHSPSKKKFYNDSFEAYGRASNQKVRTVYVMGNNDMWGKNFGPTFTDEKEEENPIMQYLLEQLEHNKIINLSKHQKKTFLRGGYYEDVLAGTTFLSLNSVIYTEQFLSSYKEKELHKDPRNQFQFLHERVKQLKLSNQPYYVGMHVCPGVDAHKQKPDLAIEPEYHKRLFEIFAEHRPLAVFCGHTHRDQMRALAGIPILNSPGISPNTMSNPAYRVVELGQKGIADYIQYFASVQNANYVGKIGFRFHYRFSELYGGPPSAVTIVSIQKRMQRDPRLFAMFFEAEDTFYQDRRQNYLCAARTLGREAYDECIELWGFKQGPTK